VHFARRTEECWDSGGGAAATTPLNQSASVSSLSTARPEMTLDEKTKKNKKKKKKKRFLLVMSFAKNRNNHKRGFFTATCGIIKHILKKIKTKTK